MRTATLPRCASLDCRPVGVIPTRYLTDKPTYRTMGCLARLCPPHIMGVGLPGPRAPHSVSMTGISPQEACVTVPNVWVWECGGANPGTIRTDRATRKRIVPSLLPQPPESHRHRMRSFYPVIPRPPAMSRSDTSLKHPDRHSNSSPEHRTLSRHPDRSCLRGIRRHRRWK